jgi:hypothetical protein
MLVAAGEQGRSASHSGAGGDRRGAFPEAAIRNFTYVWLVSGNRKTFLIVIRRDQRFAVSREQYIAYGVVTRFAPDQLQPVPTDVCKPIILWLPLLEMSLMLDLVVA